MPAIIKNYLDFEILDSDNTKLLIFIDGSEYIEEHPEKPILDILLPGFNSSFLVNIVPNRVNALNANSIGITKTFGSGYGCTAELPDGVWKISYRICPYDKVYHTKHILRTAQLQKKLKTIYKLLENTDCSLKEDRRIKNKLIDIDIFINTAKAYAEDCDTFKAGNFYQIADKFAGNLINELTNSCR